MRSKDQILLEDAYSSILNAESDIAQEKPQDQPFSCDHLAEREEEAMAKSNLYAICKHAKALLDSLESGTRLEPWQLEKIAVVTDNIQDVSQVAEYESGAQAEEFDINDIDSMEKPVDVKMESKEPEEKGNPWAICNKSTGGKKKNPEKFESCVKGVKKKSGYKKK
jgi:hypothetical protein